MLGSLGEAYSPSDSSPDTSANASTGTASSAISSAPAGPSERRCPVRVGAGGGEEGVALARGGELEAGTCLARRHELVARLLEEERLDARASTQAVRPVVLLVEAPVRRQARCALTAGSMCAGV